MELDELLAIMAAPIYAANKAKFDFTRDDLTSEREKQAMIGALKEAKQLYKIVQEHIWID
jgi:hypothetical protein